MSHSQWFAQFSFEVSSHTKKFPEIDQIQIKFATGYNCGKISEKVSYSSKAICKLLRNLTNKLVIAQNIHTVCKCRSFFFYIWTAEIIIQFEFTRGSHIKVPECRGIVGIHTQMFDRSQILRNKDVIQHRENPISVTGEI